MTHKHMGDKIQLASHSIVKSVSARVFYEEGTETGWDSGIKQVVPRWFVDLRSAGKIRVNSLMDATIYLRSDGRLYHIGKVEYIPKPVEDALGSDAEDFIEKIYKNARSELQLWECCEYIPDAECENLQNIWRVAAAAWRTGRFLYTLRRKDALQYLEKPEQFGVPWIYANTFDQHTNEYYVRYKEKIEAIANERKEQGMHQKKNKKVFEFRNIFHGSTDGVDHYKVLSLGKNAGPREIKKAYWSIAKECHPDLNPGCKLSEERFKAISRSYSELMSRYD